MDWDSVLIPKIIVDFRCCIPRDEEQKLRSCFFPLANIYFLKITALRQRLLTRCVKEISNSNFEEKKKSTDFQ